MLNGKVDWLWPSLARLPDATRAKQEARDRALLERVEGAIAAGSPQSIGELESMVRELIKDEEARGSEVGAKLTTVVGFLAIAVSMALAIFAISHADLADRFHGSQRAAAAIAAVIGFYVELQLVAACRAALRGLERHGYLSLDLDDATPRAGETDLDLLRRRTVTRAQVLLDTSPIVNRKVSHMSVSHAAVRNALWGFLAMVAALCWLLIARVLEVDDRHDPGSIATDVRTPTQSTDLSPADHVHFVRPDSVAGGGIVQDSDSSRTP